MRTTLTLDDDVAARLKEMARDQGVSFKEVVNTALRRGLATETPRRRAPRRLRVDAFRSEFRAGVDPLKLNQLVDDLEAERFAE